jgi:hypothetical protein
MRSYAAFLVGLGALVLLIGATLADMAVLQLPTTLAQADQAPVDQESADQAPLAGAPAGEARGLPEPLGRVADRAAEPDRVRNDARRARGLYMRPDGKVVGRVNYINRSSLQLFPVPNARVSFMQQRRVMAQGITGQDGVFEVSGLSAWGVYSVVISSDDWVMTVSTVTRPTDHDDDHGSRGLSPQPSAEAKNLMTNEIRLVSTNMTLLQDAEAGDENDENENVNNDDGDRDDYMDYEFLEFQTIPREDFIAALQQGLFGTDVFGPGGGPTGGLGGPGGGGGSGGGGGGAGAGAALGALGAGLGAAAGLAGQHGGELASPFTP